MSFPRLLIVTIGRLNAVDTAANGLLLRNLLGTWPRDQLAQLFSSGSNGDPGFCGREYALGAAERRLGRIYFGVRDDVAALDPQPRKPEIERQRGSFARSAARRLLVDTGAYEWVFRPRLSAALREWIEEFRPELILCQGYSLAFAWLPLMLAKRYRVPLAYYPTDDWPVDLHRGMGSTTVPFVQPVMRWIVSRSSRELVRHSTTRIAFNPWMRDEYVRRYRVPFEVLMHGDSRERFDAIAGRRVAPADVISIVATGVFDRHRAPLLVDLDQACAIMWSHGTRVMATVLVANNVDEVATAVGPLRHVALAPCPSHGDLPAVLKGADILFLAERFDESAEDVRLCVSSKAHLFMFSGRPSVIYSDPRTGIARYGASAGWAVVIERRDPGALATALERLWTDPITRGNIVAAARRTAEAWHDLASIRATFLKLAGSIAARWKGA